MHGKNRIGKDLVDVTNDNIKAYSPVRQEYLQEQFQVATTEQVDQALNKAAHAFEVYANTSGAARAAFLETIADEILAVGDKLIQRVSLETALPEGRIIGERGRTVNQLRLFAQLLRDGSWVDAAIDTAQPDRQPLAKPDVRRMLRPLGPVVVFTASNFPLAFSTAGGDTASALAAGNPVIVKAHESHLGTNELISDAIATAAAKTGMPDGVYSSLCGSGFELGQYLVCHPSTKSVAFTGSMKGGLALHKMALEREEPIPVFAEMGSINPVFLLPRKLELEATELAKTYAASITMGVGQFCTNPGLIVGLKSESFDRFSNELSDAISQISSGTMLNEGIAAAYQNNAKRALSQNGVSPLGTLGKSQEKGQGEPLVARVSGSDFIDNPALSHEVFGPFSLLVECTSDQELRQVINALQGQLTCTLMGTDQDIAEHESVINRLSAKCGRFIFNGVPTGVEVCHSMVHGGPFPASTDSRFTSVGTEAIKRFVRPVCFQDAPQGILPDELKDENPLRIWRKVNGQLSKAALVENIIDLS